MNKMVKLPLFLGVVGGICGGLLAATNMITAPKISSAEFERKNAALYEHFSDMKGEGKLQLSELELQDSLINAGINQKTEVKEGDKKLGVVYSCEVKGYIDTISFTISFANDEVHKFIVISSSENNVGGQYIDSLKGVTNAELKENMYNTSIKTTGTFKAVTNCVDVCMQDYKQSK